MNALHPAWISDTLVNNESNTHICLYSPAAAATRPGDAVHHAVDLPVEALQVDATDMGVGLAEHRSAHWVHLPEHVSVPAGHQPYAVDDGRAASTGRPDGGETRGVWSGM